MQILESCREKCTLALGNFDGLHKAHMAIINSCKSYAEKNGMKCGVLLFDRHTSSVFGKKVKLLTTMEEKLEILENFGVDFVHIMTFDEKTAATGAAEFIEQILSRFNVAAFFAGYDYTFGRAAEADTRFLAELGEKYGFEAVVSPCMTEENRVISSSYIRELLDAGYAEDAAKFLGRNYILRGEVVHGFGNGKKSLFPTANIAAAEDKFLPGDGVYAGLAHIGNRVCRTAVNVGKNPTFNAKRRTVEAYILDFDGELYGKSIEIEFVKRLRPDKKFEGAEELKEQIKKDIDAVWKMEI